MGTEIAQGEGKVKPADQLYEFACLEWKISPFMDQYGLEYVQKFDQSGYYQVIALWDDSLISDLSRLYRSKFGDVLSENILKSVIRALKVMQGLANESGCTPGPASMRD